MRIVHHIAGLLLILAADTINAQNKPLPDGLYLGVRLFHESDAAFDPGQRERPLADYRFRGGVGLPVYYTRALSSRLNWSVETGGWAFWNNATAMDTAEFKRRAIMLPLLAGIHVKVVSTPRLCLFLGLSGGVAYVQEIQRYAERLRVQTGASGLCGVTAILWFGLKRLPKPYDRSYAGMDVGVSYFTLPHATLHSAFIPFGIKLAPRAR